MATYTVHASAIVSKLALLSASFYICAMRDRGNISDKELLEKIRGGELSAYDLIFRRYYPSLCAYARLWLKDGSVVENLVQDLMLWLWENHRTLNITSSFSSYLFAAVRNRCLKQIVRDRIEHRVLEDICGKLNDEFESPDIYLVRELQGKIAEAIAALPESWRAVFEMNRFKGMTYEEIATVLGISPKTVDYRICQSLKSLRESLKDFLPQKGR